MQINRVQLGKEHLVIEGWGFIKGCQSSQTATFIKIYNDKSSITLKPRIKPRSDLAGRFSSPDRESAGFISIVSNKLLNQGERYQLEIELECDEHRYRQQSRYLISKDTVTKMDKKK